jgi:bifunctional UDP-N-acetylglucosamine pyrophosphorylase / glucosamine-1-phosphate N-acetyltransferase
MDLKPACQAKIIGLLEKGVDIPNPLTLDIGEEVDVDRVSGRGVKIYPGCRIYGKKTVISAGAQLGYEGPVTIDDCQIASRVELKGGYFYSSVFLEGASMGLGAQVREGCTLEEEASGAHCVGLKQTILFPFVTLGSLINFCDCLMAGGTSRRNHSEVGSSYIHFNFTPDGDKTTPSLIGDVPRGVMLDQPPIFLGGQGGLVGPLVVGFGNVVAAGSILRRDYLEENTLIVGKTYAGGVRGFAPRAYGNLSHIVENNIRYVANIAALGDWYRHVRRSFLEQAEFGAFIYEGLLDKLGMARKERLKRLRAMAERACGGLPAASAGTRDAVIRRELLNGLESVEALFLGETREEAAEGPRDEFLSDFRKSVQVTAGGYIDAVQRLTKETSAKGVTWLEDVVKSLCEKASETMPSLNLFKRTGTSSGG